MGKTFRRRPPDEGESRSESAMEAWRSAAASLRCKVSNQV